MESMQTVYDYTIAHPDLDDDDTPVRLMTEAEYGELFSLFDTSGLPEAAMSAEMADGYLTACVIGPEQPLSFEWLAAIFKQYELPVCADTAVQARLFELLEMRMRDIRWRINIPREESTPDSIFTPLQAELLPNEIIVPYQFDKKRRRLGPWMLKDWAQGFRQRIAEDNAWAPLFESPDDMLALSVVLIYEQGYNPNQAQTRLENNTELLGYLVSTLHSIHEFWSAWTEEHPFGIEGDDYAVDEPYVRDSPKIGRNDPCPCGSGKKYKKCCGA
jgi:uncharacterized protein